MLETLIAYGKASLLRKARGADKRGGRLVAVIECMLNQNARDAGAATCPSMNGDVVELCREHGVGILQMPCPEVSCLGINRTRTAGQSIRGLLDTDSGRHCCRTIAMETANRLEMYDRAGYRVLAVLGGNVQSPGCAVHGHEQDLLPESGILMQELHAELRKRGLQTPFRGMRDASPELLAEDLRWLRSLFTASFDSAWPHETYP
ncbi:MAG: hypothetical protein H6935_04685 [Thiobacillus sp.]|nr:hypothetical protein [Thiobacillus sp.]